MYEAVFSNLGLKGVTIGSGYVKDFDKLLAGGIWCIVQMEYFFDEEAKGESPFSIDKVTPIQMPNMDLDELFALREHFSIEEWIDAIIRSIGMEPTQL